MSNINSIIIAGDISPTRSYKNNFFADKLVDKKINTLLSSSYAVANLESPLTLSREAISKTGPSLKGHPTDAKEIAKLDINAVCLANNHIMDFDNAGLIDTISSCNKYELSTFGAGNSKIEASRPHIIEINNKRILFFGLAESEFSIATENSAGAYPANAIDFIDLLNSHKSDGDKVIILLHMGMAMYNLPSPELQNLCRFMIRYGADVIICQHSHCIGTYERYNAGLIFYGQGNFIFDGVPSAPTAWYNGYLIKLYFNHQGFFDFELFPFQQTRSKPFVQVMSELETNKLLCQLDILAKRLNDKIFIKSSWDEFIAKDLDYYLSILSGHSRFLRIANKYLHFLNLQYKGKSRKYLLNIIRSETHREAILSLLKK